MFTRRAAKATHDPPQSTFQSFARVTKASANRSAMVQIKDACGPTSIVPASLSPSKITSSSKRKRHDAVDNVDEKGFPAAKRSKTAPISSTNARGDTLRTPTKKARFVNSLLTPDSTPTSSRKAVSIPESIESFPLQQRSYFTPPHTPRNTTRHTSSDSSTSELPEELQALIQLHTCIAKALSLHSAHNGFGAPIDVRLITPSISKIWGVRRTTLEDLRRSLGLLIGREGNPMALNIHLANYGGGKICIERDNHEMAAIDENLWNEDFRAELDCRWRKWTMLETTTKLESISDFIASLPLAAITDCSSLVKMRPTQRKGQQRLEDLKFGAIKAQIKAQITPVSIDAQAKTAIKNRSQGLLERLQAKGREASDATGTPETPEQLLRRTAIDRMDEVTKVLSLAKSIGGAAGNRQHTHSLNVLVDNVQHSTRNAISKAEAEETIRVIAERAPEFVSLIAVGRVTCVVINASMRPKNLKAL